jgi:hypothetical protein
MGTAFQLNPAMLMYRAVAPGEPLFRCSVCQSIATRSLAGVCPTMRCPGTLASYTLPAPANDTNHYRALYRTMTPVPLSAKEHTAQWSPEEAASIQNQFVQGEVNALSCSTTFELGVDVGELQSVLLRNVPPTTANYVQRAGRAGRRASSAALALTYADRRSHDLSMYEDPVAMIAGAVRSPVVPIENARIARRHAQSIAIAAFLAYQWRTEHVQWRQAGPFFLGGNGVPEAISALSTYLTRGAEELSVHAMQVLPPATHEDAGLLDQSWIPELIQDLVDVQSELSDAVSYFDSQEQEARDAGKYRKAEMFKRVGNTYRARDLIGYLGTKNILPKYGFPVDVVELRTFHLAERVATRLDLQRDLAVAIYEYAPGASIIAGGKQWTSGGVYRLPNRDLPFGYYILCSCGQFEERREQPHDESACPGCGGPVKWLRHVTPEFGFAAAADIPDAGLEPPTSTWSGGTHVLSHGEVLDVTTQLPASFCVTIGRRATLMALNEGPGSGGYRLCDWCGYGEPCNRPLSKRAHRHLTKPSNDCTGPLRTARLSHSFQTDTVRISGVFESDHDIGGIRSVLYALLAAAANVLEIAREDVDGAALTTQHGFELIIFDAVAGGAGTALAIGERFPEVVAEASRIVSACSCGEDSSCYACLKSFRNQKFHGQLVRGVAKDLLAEFVSRSSADIS